MEMLQSIPGISNMPTLAGLTWYQLIGLGLVGVVAAKLLHAAVKTAIYIGLIIVVVTTVIKIV